MLRGMSTITTGTSLPAFLNALDAARAGVERGVQAHAQSAYAVATAGMRGEVPAVEPVVRALEARQQVAASVRVLQAVDRSLGTLLDVRA